MSFSSDEVNFLVYRYLQVRVKYVFFVYKPFLHCILFVLVTYRVSIVIILLLREPKTYQPTFLFESTFCPRVPVPPCLLFVFLSSDREAKVLLTLYMYLHCLRTFSIFIGKKVR
jgi:hypothetical protein